MRENSDFDEVEQVCNISALLRKVSIQRRLGHADRFFANSAVVMRSPAAFGKHAREVGFPEWTGGVYAATGRGMAA